MAGATAVALPRGVSCAVFSSATTRPQPTLRYIRFEFFLLVFSCFFSCFFFLLVNTPIGCQLHTVAVERVLSMQVGAASFALPLWLTAALTARAPAALMSLFVDYDHVPEAVRLAINVINAQVAGCVCVCV
jgi:hypothetical protein